MKKCQRYICLVMCVIIAVCSCFVTASAEGEGKRAYINGDGVRLRSEPTTQVPDGFESNVLATLLANSEITVNSTVTGEEINGNNTWYHVTYKDVNGNELTGYIYGPYVSFPPSREDYVYDENFENNIANFPESYRDSLRALHSKYPNWRFKAFNVGMSFDEAVNTQYNVDDFTKTRKYYTLSNIYGGDEWRDTRAFDAATGTWIQPEQGWTYASRTAIAYYMDPRNFLTENEIFMFAQQSYDAQTQTEDLLRKVIAGHFLEKGYDLTGDGDTDDDGEKDAYIRDIMQAAAESHVNPFVIAAMIIGEQSENSPLISGNYTYTYTYAEIDPATNEERIVEVTEDYTGHYNFFNIGAYGPTKDEIYRKGLTFAKEQNPPWNSRSASITGGAKWYEDGYIGIGQDTYYFMNFNIVNKIYFHQYAGNVRDAYNKACKLDDAFVNNTDATVEFIIPVFTDIPDAPQQNTPPPEPVIPKGDANFDGAIDVVDLAAVKMDILGIRKLEGDAFVASDINNDGVVDVVDLAAVKMHILGLRNIE